MTVNVDEVMQILKDMKVEPHELKALLSIAQDTIEQMNRDLTCEALSLEAMNEEFEDVPF